MKRLLFALALLFCASAAHAGSYSTRQMFMSTSGTYGPTLSVPGFNASLGTLDSVQVVVDRVYGQFPIQCENLDTQRTLLLFGTAAVPAGYGYFFRVNGAPVGAARATLAPFAAPLSAYDGTTDFSGPSGITTLVTGVAYNIVCEPTSNSGVLSDALYPVLAVQVLPMISLWVPHSITGGPLASAETEEPKMRAKLHFVYTYH